MLPALVAEGRSFSGIIGPEWLQGRTAFGGASAAIALSAVKAAFPDLPPLRSFQGAFVGPLAGAVQIVPSLLRRGKNSAFVACDVIGEDGVGLRLLFLFMASRASVIEHPATRPPEVDPPEDGVFDATRLPQGFLSNFDLAKAGPVEAGFARWARLHDRDSLDPEVEFVVIADALPPAAMALAPQWGPISTTTWQVNLVTNAIRTRDGWWLLRAETLHAADGSSSQAMTIWNRDGDAIATATQSVALFL